MSNRLRCAAPVAAALLLLTAAGALPDDAALGPNLIRNADLTTGPRGLQDWQLEQMPPAAAALTVLPPSAGPQSPAGTGSVASVAVTELGREKWHVQLEQRGLDLMDGEPYTLAFWARADRERPISLNANVDVADGHGIGLTQDAISVSPAWHKYMYVFTASRPVKDRCRVTWLLGEARGTVQLAGFVLRHGKATRSVGPNLVRNGAFGSGSAEWSFDLKAPAEAAMQVLGAAAAPPGVGSRVAHVDVRNAGRENWHVQLAEKGLDLVQGESYSLSFWARADRVRSMSVQSSVDMPDWHRIAPDNFVTLTPEWKQYNLLLTAAHPVQAHSRLVFILGDATGAVDVAEVALRHEVLREVGSSQIERTAAGAAVRPVAHPLVGTWESTTGEPAKRLRFTFNPDGTGSIRGAAEAESTASAPSRPVGNAFRWYVAPGGRKVVIGTKTYNWSIVDEGLWERLVLTEDGGKSHSLIRRPNG